MKGFEEFKSDWKKQELGEQTPFDQSKVDSVIAKLAKDQNLTPIILGATVLVLIGFLFTQPKESFDFLRNGILLMSFSLLVRIVFEFWSSIMLKNVDVKEEVNLFLESLTKFQRTRKIIHFIITPIILVIYMLAFYSLLPIFKVNVSAAMYTYIFWSSVAFFTAFFVFKLFLIPQELEVIKQLKNQLEELNS